MVTPTEPPQPVDIETAYRRYLEHVERVQAPWYGFDPVDVAALAEWITRRVAVGTIP
jgi:hypothetical protein